jgi:hypothetical protein
MFYFLAALVLLERDEGSLQARRVTPLRQHEYLGSKLMTLTALALAENLIIVVLFHGTGFRWLLMSGAIVVASALLALLGVIAVARHDSINTFLMPSVHPIMGAALLLLVPMLVITLAAAPAAPLYAMVLAAFADNKVQGFALIKVAGAITTLPAFALFLDGPAKLVLGVVPTWWPTRLYVPGPLTASCTRTQSLRSCAAAGELALIVRVSAVGYRRAVASPRQAAPAHVPSNDAASLDGPLGSHATSIRASPTASSAGRRARGMR